MATSGSYDFVMNRNEIIEEAYRTSQIYDQQKSITAYHLKRGRIALNNMIQTWSSMGIKLWNRRIGYLFPVYNQLTYTLGTTGDHATTSYVKTLINGAVSSGASSITVDSTTGMTANDNIGVVLSDGTRQWTTISSVDTSTILTLADSLTGAVSDDALVISYTSKLHAPLEIMSMRRVDIVSDTTIALELDQIRLDDMLGISARNVGNYPSRYNYVKPQVSSGTLRIHPQPQDLNYILEFTYHDAVEIFSSATDNPDFPPSWNECIIANLKVELARQAGQFTEIKEQYQPVADKLLAIMMKNNTDEEPLRIIPDMEDDC